MHVSIIRIDTLYVSFHYILQMKFFVTFIWISCSLDTHMTILTLSLEGGTRSWKEMTIQCCLCSWNHSWIWVPSHIWLKKFQISRIYWCLHWKLEKITRRAHYNSTIQILQGCQWLANNFVQVVLYWSRVATKRKWWYFFRKKTMVGSPFSLQVNLWHYFYMACVIWTRLWRHIRIYWYVGVIGEGWHYLGVSNEAWALNLLLEKSEGGIGGRMWNYDVPKELILAF